MIHRDDRDGVAVLRMEHGKVNAVDSFLFDALGAAVDEIESDDTIRALVLTGTGSNFSAGVNLKSVVEDGRSYLESFLPKLSDSLLRFFRLKLPVVAAVNGHAIAGGLILALAADRRIATSGKAKLGLTELLVGVPFPAAPIEVARFALTAQHLQDLVLSGRLVGPEEALAMGLVDELVAPEEVVDRAVATAAKMGRIAREGFALTKRLLRTPTAEQIARARAATDDLVLEAWSRPETLGRIRAFLEATVGKK